MSVTDVHKAYLACLPPAVCPHPLPEIRVRSWRWRDLRVHVERTGDPESSVRVVLFHGAGGHSAALWPFAAAAAGHGLEVVVPDMPGYGRTRVPDRRKIRYPDWIELACDLVEGEKQDGTRTLWLVGASMGGMLAYEAATRTGAVDRVLATCLLDPRNPQVRAGIARWPWLGRMARPALRLARGPIADVMVPIRWLANMQAISNNPEVVELIVRDEYGGGNKTPVGFLASYLDSRPCMEPEEVTHPEFVLAHPAADRWTPVQLSLPFFDRIAAPKRLVMLERSGHFPIEEPAVRQLIDVLTRA